MLTRAVLSLVLGLPVIAGCVSTQVVTDTAPSHPLDATGREAVATLKERRANLLAMPQYSLVWRDHGGGRPINAAAVVERGRAYLEDCGKPRLCERMEMETLPSLVWWRRDSPRTHPLVQSWQVYPDRHIIVSIDPLVVIVVPMPVEGWPVESFATEWFEDGDLAGRMLLADGMEFGARFESPVAPSEWYCPDTGETGRLVGFPSSFAAGRAAFSITSDSGAGWSVSRAEAD